MEIQALFNVFVRSYSSDKAEREQATQTLEDLKATRGFLVSLFGLIVSDVDINVRKAAAVFFKNLCGIWDSQIDVGGDGEAEAAAVVGFFSDLVGGGVRGAAAEPASFFFDEADKAVIRENIVEGIIHASPSVLRILGASFVQIARCDYPARWPSLLPKLVATLASQGQPGSDVRAMYGAIYALRLLAKVYEFRQVEMRQPLEELCAATFPHLLPLAQGLLAVRPHSPEAGTMLNLCLKIVWSSFRIRIPECVAASPHTFAPWFSLLFAVLELPLPAEIVVQSPSGNPLHVFWNIKKWALRVFCRLFQRFGDPESAGTKEQKKFAHTFQRVYVAQLTEAVVAFLKHNFGPALYMPSRVLREGIHFLEISVPFAKSWAVLRKHLTYAFTDVVLPTLALTADDLRLWREDATEYVRRNFDVSVLYYLPSPTAENLLIDLAKNRVKQSHPLIARVLFDALAYFHKSSVDSGQLSYEQALQKECTLHALGCVLMHLATNSSSISLLVQALVRDVLPELCSPHAFLRARACWMIARADCLKLDPGLHVQFLGGVLQRIGDPELPVRVEAAQAIPILLSPGRNQEDSGPPPALSDEALQLVDANLVDLFQAMFMLISEVGVEEVVSSLSLVIDRLGPRIAPTADGLLSSLIGSFREQVVHMYSNPDDPEESSGLAAVECVRAIDTLLESVAKASPELFSVLGERVITELVMVPDPNLPSLLSLQLQEFVDEAVMLILTVVLGVTQLTPTLWRVYEELCRAQANWAAEFLKETFLPIHAYFHREPATFLESSRALEQFLGLGLRVLRNEQSCEMDCQQAAKLIGSVFNHAGVSQDLAARLPLSGFVPAVLETLVMRMEIVKTQHLKSMIIGTIAMACHYDAALVIARLEACGWTQKVLEAWTGNVRHWVRKYDHAVSVLGLLSLLRIPPEEMPALMSVFVPRMVVCLIRSMAKYEKGDDDDSDTESEGEEDTAVAEDSGDEDEEEEEDDDVGGEDGTIREADEVVDFDELGEWDDEDDLDFDIFASPIDTIDYLGFFGTTMDALLGRQEYQMLVATLRPKEQGLLRQLMTKFRDREGKKAQRRRRRR